MGSLTVRPDSDPSSELQTALDALRRIVQALRVSAAQAQHDTGLGAAQLFVLQQLEASPLSINALAARTHTHQSSVSAVVQRLAAAGLVERGASASDGRKVEARLTPRGRTLMRRAPVVTQDALIGALEALPAKARAALASGLQQLADGMGLDPSAPMFFEEAPEPRQGAKGSRAAGTNGPRAAQARSNAARASHGTEGPAWVKKRTANRVRAP
jgi:DNA-binding MarR family transcriptional regulator